MLSASRSKEGWQHSKLRVSGDHCSMQHAAHLSHKGWSGVCLEFCCSACQGGSSARPGYPALSLRVSLVGIQVQQMVAGGGTTCAWTLCISAHTKEPGPLAHTHVSHMRMKIAHTAAHGLTPPINLLVFERGSRVRLLDCSVLPQRVMCF